MTKKELEAEVQKLHEEIADLRLQLGRALATPPTVIYVPMPPAYVPAPNPWPGSSPIYSPSIMCGGISEIYRMVS